MAKDINELSVIAEIEKKFGKGNIFKFSDKASEDIPVISTGSIGLDAALGVGGIPCGRITEIFGGEASGKTSLCLQIAANCQKTGGRVVYVDAENALDVTHAKLLGVNVDEMYISQPDTAQQTFGIIEEILKSGDFQLVVVDSVAALVSEQEANGEFGDSVTFDTPVYIRHKKNKSIEIVAIADLYAGRKDFLKNSNQNWYRKLKTYEILTHDGWSDINGVVKKKNVAKKEIIVSRTPVGVVRTTKDHSLFKGGVEIKPTDLKIGDLLDIVSTPSLELNKETMPLDIAWLLGFWCAEGATTSLDKRTKNRFETSNTDLLVITKTKDIVDRFFISDTKISVRTYTDGVRKPLHILQCTANKELGRLMESCTGKQTRLKQVPASVINGTNDIKQSFLDGFFAGDGSHGGLEKEGNKYYNNSMPIIAGLQFLLNQLGKKNSLFMDKNRLEQLVLAEISKFNSPDKKENQIINFYTQEAPEILYDISTEQETFVSALGNIVLHNSNIGVIAKLMAQACRKLTPLINKHNVAVIFINQVRDLIGVMFGPNTTTTGGRALKFFASVRIESASSTQIKDGDTVVGRKMKYKVVKNKVAPPFLTAEFDVTYGQNWVMYNEVIELGSELKIIEKSGSWYSYNGTRLGQGTANVRQYLIDNSEVMQEIEAKIRTELGVA